MKPRTISEMIRAKGQIERGEVAPARVWELKPDGKEKYIRRELEAKAFQRAQKAAWDNNQ